MKQKIKLLVCVLLMSVTSIIGQTIKGKITDTNGIGLPFVNVIEKGTTNGITTDDNGEYFLKVSKLPATVIVSSVGFRTKELIVTDDSYLTIVIEESSESLEEVVIVGSRNKGRVAIDSPVAIDVLDVSKLTESAPQVTVTEILNYAAPSFNSNPQSISDGTDHIAPAALRGLGPDQVLVLINGKRRHKTALVNVNGTFGRGSVGTDMTTIPSMAIERIEILRDGAAAQYGSDAIAGIINIVLKKSTNKLEVNLTTGANFTSESSPEREVDGEKLNLGLNYGMPIGKDGGV